MKINDPDSFYRIIPKDVKENILFRQKFAELSADDTELQKVFLEMCGIKPQIAYNLVLWTYNPRNEEGMRHLPFILREPQQELAVDEIKSAILNRTDLLIEKSRDEGATEIISKYFVLDFILHDGGSYLVGSRKEDYVDGSTSIDLANNRVTGSARSIFHKMLYGIVHLPAWMIPNILKTHMHIENLNNGSVIDGEATNENFGAGDRRTAILLDEFGRVEHRIAQNIRDSVADVSDCVIYNSTHFYGRSHPFAKLRYSGKVKVFLLPWYKNPEKTHGLYSSPSLNFITIKDLEYYKNKFPKAFNGIEENVPFKWSDLKKKKLNKTDFTLIADGADKLRSEWYDKETDRRDPRDVAQNIDMSPLGSSDMLFDPMVLQKIRVSCLRKPMYEGEMKFNFDRNKKLTNIRFENNYGQKRVKWWGALEFGRPNQSHNYIVACDISLGTGASNSTCSIVDYNTSEKIGSFVSPDLPPEDFATYVIALCHWIGGANGKPYLIFENNGLGKLFDKRRREIGYTFTYVDRDERKKTPKVKNVYGWTSGKTQKFDILIELRAALAEGLRDLKKYKYLIIYDEDTLNEYDDYIFYDNGDIGLSLSQDESSGAKKAHGDRVIADAMAVRAMNTFHKASSAQHARVADGSMAYRRQLYLDEKKKEKENSPW